MPDHAPDLSPSILPDLVAILTLTLRVAATALSLIAVPGIALAYVLARRNFWGKSLIETGIALPLVLPPTAIGYLLLRLFAVDGPLGVDHVGVDLGVLLTWKGATVASGIMAWPLLVRTARIAFEGVDTRLEGVARTLGLPPGKTFLRVTLPLAARGLLGALILAFARALGEFGATIVVAGNLPGQTRTLALAIFSAEQAGRSGDAQILLGIAVLLGFLAVWLVERLSRSRGAARFL